MDPSNDSLTEIAWRLAAQQATKTSSPYSGKAFLAISGSMLWPGVGQIIAGHRKRGWTWAIAAAAIVIACIIGFLWQQFLPALFVLVPLAMLLEFVQLLDAAIVGRRSDSPLLGDPTARFLVGGALFIVALFSQYSAITYVQSNWLELCYSPTPSMSPNISPGDVFLAIKNQPIHRWDIIGLTAPPGPHQSYGKYCKRVVGLPGEQVEITGDGLLIDGKPVTPPSGAGPYFPVDTYNEPLSDSEPMSAANGCWGKPILLGPDEYFVLGDNTAISDDARFWPPIEGHQPGALPRDQIVSRIIGIVWPPMRWRTFN